MKIALISDIHGNLPALEAVLEDVRRWRPDRVIVNGDVVNRGPSSAETLHLVLAEATEDWSFVRGNHEDYVLEHTAPVVRDIRFEINQLAHWTAARLGPAVHQLADWPLVLEAPFQLVGLRATHASMKSNRDGISPFSDDDTVAEQIAPAPVVFATGHVHWPYVRTVGETLVVNSGSVGSPADQDVRASYGRLEHRDGTWSATIARVDYDREATQRAFEETGFLTDSGPVSRIIHAEWQRAFPMVGRWFTQYADAVQAGEIGLVEAVDTFLAGESRGDVATNCRWFLARCGKTDRLLNAVPRARSVRCRPSP